MRVSALPVRRLGVKSDSFMTTMCCVPPTLRVVSSFWRLNTKFLRLDNSWNVGKGFITP